MGKSRVMSPPPRDRRQRGVASGSGLRELPRPQPWYLQAAVVALRDLVEGDVQERDLVVAQDFVAVEDLGRAGRVSDTEHAS